MKYVKLKTGQHYSSSFLETLLIKQSYKLIIKRIDGKNLSIIDVGCGSDIGIKLMEKNNRVIGLDIKPYFQGKRFECIIGNVHAIPLKDNTFDAVTSRSSVNYWNNKNKSISEIIRILKPGGKFFIISIKHYKRPMRYLLLLLNYIICTGKKEKIEETKYFLETALQKEEIKKLMSKFPNVKYRITNHLLIYFCIEGKKLF